MGESKYLKTSDPEFIKIFASYWTGREKISQVPGFPEGLDLENWEINAINNTDVQMVAGGDWQDMIPFSFAVEARGKKPVIIDRFYTSSHPSPAKKIRDFTSNFQEEASRPVTTIKFSFPKGLVGVSDIHSQSQLQGFLTSFGRGVVDESGKVKIGPVGSSHAGLSQGLKDPKRFYFGYSKEQQTVYVVSKNGMDDSFIRGSRILPVILSNVFDMYKLSIAQGKKLQFKESFDSPLGDAEVHESVRKMGPITAYISSFNYNGVEIRTTLTYFDDEHILEVMFRDPNQKDQFAKVDRKDNSIGRKYFSYLVQYLERIIDSLPELDKVIFDAKASEPSKVRLYTTFATIMAATFGGYFKKIPMGNSVTFEVYV